MSVGPGMMAGTVSSAAVASSSSAVARAVMMMHQGMNQTCIQIQATFLFQSFERTLISPEPFMENASKKALASASPFLFDVS